MTKSAAHVFVIQHVETSQFTLGVQVAWLRSLYCPEQVADGHGMAAMAWQHVSRGHTVPPHSISPAFLCGGVGNGYITQLECNDPTIQLSVATQHITGSAQLGTSYPHDTAQPGITTHLEAGRADHVLCCACAGCAACSHGAVDARDTRRTLDEALVIRARHAGVGRHTAIRRRVFAALGVRASVGAACAGIGLRLQMRSEKGGNTFQRHPKLTTA